MGYELARAAATMGAEVILVSGPSHEVVSSPQITCIRVTTAQEMLEVTLRYFETCMVFIGAAAVADYRPKQVAAQKLKKDNTELELKLERNPDILKTLSSQKTHQFVVGFALETERETEYAKNKLIEKNLDAIVLNSLNEPGAGFSSDTNKVSFIDKNLEIKSFELKTKANVAVDILDEIRKRL
jgi:phosphopantothenoylcysteine decarboxylase/phosphopantothenate--cysteine ligase